MVVRATTSTTATAPFNILDVYTGAAAAYSLRKLRGAYSGAAVRVRRSNDNAEQDIGFDANGNFNESALTSFVGANSAFVTTWYDQSGNTRNATQATAANQPRIVNAGVVDKVNGRVSPAWQSNRYYALTAPISITQNILSVFDVSRINSGTTYPRIVVLSNASNTDLDPNTFIAHLYNPGLNVHSAYKNGFSNGVAHTLGVLQQVTSMLNNSAHSIYRNSGTPAVSTLDGTTLAVTNLTIGNKVVIADIDLFEGFIPEVILYTSNQSANRATIEANIMSYYGIN
jgi:hypothetical protein